MSTKGYEYFYNPDREELIIRIKVEDIEEATKINDILEDCLLFHKQLEVI